MIRTIGNETLFWMDVVDPSETELGQIAERYTLHPTSLKDCLDPMHLPKYESYGDIHFLILRHADKETFRLRDADTIRELTRKLVLFVFSKGIISIHRSEQDFVTTLFEEWKTKGLNDHGQIAHVVNSLVKRSFLSFGSPMDYAEDAFEEIELKVLNRRSNKNLIEDLYFLKRKVFVYKKMLRADLEAIERNENPDVRKSTYYQDVHEEGVRQFAHAEELVEDFNHLMQTQLSLASLRTNEVMRVLTIFSVFFMPLTFIVGIYGMNFQFMPELRWKYGYLLVIVIMVLVSGGIFTWFRRKGWIGVD
jgi:magnesium transporter